MRRDSAIDDLMQRPPRAFRQVHPQPPSPIPVDASLSSLRPPHDLSRCRGGGGTRSLRGRCSPGGGPPHLLQSSSGPTLPQEALNSERRSASEATYSRRAVGRD